MSQTFSPQPRVSANLLARLSRGANLSMWFRFPREPTEDHFRHYLTDADLDLIEDLGLTAVRLAVSPEQILASGRRDEPDPLRLAWLAEAVVRLAARGLAVVVEIHLEAGVLESGQEAVAAFARFWSILAACLASIAGPESLVLEPLNEPVFLSAPLSWFPVRRQVLAALRAAAPRHTLVASGPVWSSVDWLPAGPPEPDPNVIYTFHFYEPYLFTHQGAPWASDPAPQLSGVPYPSSRENTTAPLAAATDRATRRALRNYGRERWDAQRITQRILPAVRWAAAHGVPLWAGEFGAYPPAAPREDRLRWFADVRTVLERHDIGWAVWSYDEGLGLGRQIDAAGGIGIDAEVARALGLRA